MLTDLLIELLIVMGLMIAIPVMVACAIGWLCTKEVRDV